MSLRTLTLPVNSAAVWTQFAWPSKDPEDVLGYQLDCTAWLADAGTTLVGATVSTSADLTVSTPSIANGIVAVQISGGTPSLTDTVALTLALANGDELEVLIALRIRAGVPAGLVSPMFGFSLISDDFANLLADDFGGHLIAS